MSKEEGSSPNLLDDLNFLEHFYKRGGSDGADNVVRQFSPFLSHPNFGSQNKVLMRTIVRKYCRSEETNGVKTFHLKAEFLGKLPSDILAVDVSSLRRRSRTLPIYEPSEQDEINRFIPPKSIQERVEFPKIESEEENNEPNPPPLPERKYLSLPAIGPHLPLDLGQPPLLPPKRKLPSPIEKKPPPLKLNSSERPPLPEKPNAIKMRPLDSDVPHQPLSRTNSNPTSLAHEERPALPSKYKQRPGPRSDELSNKKETFKAQKSVKEIRSQFESITDDCETSSTIDKSGPNDRRLRRRPSSVVVPKLNTEIQTWLRLVSKTNPDLSRVLKVVEKNHRILGVQDLCGYTGLHWLCKQGNFEAVDRLFKANLVHRSDLNARSRGGYTALMLCAIQRHSKLYNMMREQPNLNLSMRDYSGRTAEHFYGEDQEEDLTDGRRDLSGGERYASYSRQDSRTSRGRERVHRGAKFLRNVVRQSGIFSRE